MHSFISHSHSFTYHREAITSCKEIKSFLTVLRWGKLIRKDVALTRDCSGRSVKIMDRRYIAFRGFIGRKHCSTAFFFFLFSSEDVGIVYHAMAVLLTSNSPKHRAEA